jgi:hypothetical protein
LAVANANLSGESIDGHGEFCTAREDLFGERFREFNAAGAAKMTRGAIAYISPTLQENFPLAVFSDDIETAFETDNEVKGSTAGAELLLQRLCPLPRAAHQLSA